MRSPHHTASAASLVGGGGVPRPGEASLAHHGVLFLDELPEFPRQVLEVLREPLESGVITISRAAAQLEFPARFQLVAAMNPCPCGYLGDSAGECRCSGDQVQRYRSRLSGPLLDRIDLHVEVSRLPAALLIARQRQEGDCSSEVQKRVAVCRERQLRRQDEPNGWLSGSILEQHCQLQREEERFLLKAIDALSLSGRSYHRVLRVARTVADLVASERVTLEHLAEAVSFRKFDRNIDKF